MADEMEGERSGLLTADMAGKLLMVSGERVRQLSKLGWIPKAGHNKFFLVDVVQGYIRFRNDADRRSTKTAAASRVSDARAREIELKNAERERRVMNVEDHLSTVDDIVGILRTELSGLAAASSRDLQVRRVIDANINAALQRISDRAAKEASRFEAAVRADEAVADHVPGQMGGGEPEASEHDGRSGSA